MIDLNIRTDMTTGMIDLNIRKDMTTGMIDLDIRKDMKMYPTMGYVSSTKDLEQELINVPHHAILRYKVQDKPEIRETNNESFWSGTEL